MRLPRPLRTPIALGVLVLCFTAASRVDAAPLSKHARSSAGWKAHTSATLKKLLQRARSSSAPTGKRARLSRLGVHFDLSPHFQRIKHNGGADDDAAIQNDAAAAPILAHAALTGLRPIGFFVGAVDSHPRTRSFSPRSPRGPPAPV